MYTGEALGLSCLLWYIESRHIIRNKSAPRRDAQSSRVIMYICEKRYMLYANRAFILYSNNFEVTISKSYGKLTPRRLTADHAWRIKGPHHSERERETETERQRERAVSYGVISKRPFPKFCRSVHFYTLDPMPFVKVFHRHDGAYVCVWCVCVCACKFVIICV